MDESRRDALSKALAGALAGDGPASRVDGAGWAWLADLADGLAAADPAIDRASLPAEIAALARRDHLRFEVDGARVRARDSRGLRPTSPPERLFFGTDRQHLAAILAEGLSPTDGPHVQLSTDVGSARRVARRRGVPVVLQVDAARLHAEEGAVFLLTEHGVWLTARVPRDYLLVEE